jgi:2-dehydro-3-deoxygluconokinase
VTLNFRSISDTRWDVVSLGEVMLRLDPESGRVRTTRHFRATEGGGEYNVARAARKVFGLRSAIVTAIVDNEIGHLVEDLIMTGGTDTRHITWVPFDGIGDTARQGLNFTEKGFGIRPAKGVSDRAHTAVSHLKPGDIDWDMIFGTEGVRWFHTGGIFAALSESTSEVAIEALTAARAHGTVTSFDLNYRPSLWRRFGGEAAAIETNRRIAPLIDVMIGNEEDFVAGLGFKVEDLDEQISALDTGNYKEMITKVAATYPNLAVVATTLRTATSANRNDWGGILWHEGSFNEARTRMDLEIYDRVGGGDAFASGLAYALLEGMPPSTAVEYGAAHGALAMTTPGDTSMATLSEVVSAITATTARVVR